MTVTDAELLRLLVSVPDSPDSNPAAPQVTLVLEAASAHAWRVRDSRVMSGQGRFVGFIEQRADDFEVMEFADDFVWTAFPTMQAALAHIARSQDHPAGR